MKNAILPSVSSQLYSYGNNAIITEIPVQMDGKVNVYASFCMDSRLYSGQNQLSEGFATQSQFSLNCQPGPSSLMTMEGLDYPWLGDGYLSTYDYDIPQKPLSHNKKLPVPQCQADFQGIQNSRKRPIDITKLVSKRNSSKLVGNKSALNEGTRNKKMELCFQEQGHTTIQEERMETQRAPARRSQKLSDRITALQKLVSPYGKADTASVLQEASISIKVLQDQIQNLLETLSTSYVSIRPLHSQLQETGGKQFNLRNRELCLVPVSFTHRLAKEGHANPHAA
ncbi:unnamed protein product [Ilex paraguariensis]|uniref:BHLH domain-containing protein n=1 Tax=Ilex paraguariensis TaxID=185542 RepID=A0ABC8T9J7_9AQUA